MWYLKGIFCVVFIREQQKFTRTKNNFLHIVKRIFMLFTHYLENEKLIPCNHNFLGFLKTIKEAHWCSLNGNTVARFGLALLWGSWHSCAEIRVFKGFFCVQNIQMVWFQPCMYFWMNADGKPIFSLREKIKRNLIRVYINYINTLGLTISFFIYV